MAFDASKFAKTSHHDNYNIPSTFAYTTTDSAATIDTTGYFNEVADQLKKGDLIYVYYATGGTPAAGLFWVKDHDGKVVDVADVLALTATDTD